MTFILYAILAWFLYNIIVKFVVPLYITTKQVKKQFSEMKERANAYTNGQNPNYPDQDGYNTKATPEKEKAGEYIEFEEVK